MENQKFFLLLVCLCVTSGVLALPVGNTNSEFCSEADLLNYVAGNTYVYEYKTVSSLWINDVSEESKSSAELTATVRITRRVGGCGCRFDLVLSDAKLTGSSIDERADALQPLTLPASFRLNTRGELDASVRFAPGDAAWSRNVKRGVISAFQVKSESNLRSLNEIDVSKKSAVVYENDVLGNCRTTYTLERSDDYVAARTLKLHKIKSLQRCTLNSNSKTSAIQYVPYLSIPEFYDGRLFIETYHCESEVQDNRINEVECKEKSTYKIGSRGDKGAQAVVEQKLKFKSMEESAATVQPVPTEEQPISFEFSDKSVEDVELKNFNETPFLTDLCTKTSSEGLSHEHSNNFRKLVYKLKLSTKAQLQQLYNANENCELARLTVASALLFTDTETSFELVLELLERNAYAHTGLITEFPLLTALARAQSPSRDLLNKLRSNLAAKSAASFPYLRKMYLVFSALVRTHCKSNKCAVADLQNWSSLFSSQLGTNCDDAADKDLLTTLLKAIGNIGYIGDASVLVSCATRKANPVEVRLGAVEAFRSFDCEANNPAFSISSVLADTTDDTELRIAAFLTLVRCSDTEQFDSMASTVLPAFFARETDAQVLAFIMDYAKEHGLTKYINPILADPQVRERFEVNFKELSWNNYRHSFSVMRDGAIETETSVIFASRFIPRSVRFNVTLHLHGMSVNILDITLRLQGLDDFLKAVLIDKLTAADLWNRVRENPDSLLELLRIVAEKLKFDSEKALVSLSMRVYGAEVFFSELNDAEKLKKLVTFLKSPRDYLLYAQVNTVKNFFLIDSRVRQPLANGFEFNAFLDVSAGIYLSKQSSKQELADNRKEFSIKNFYSFSGSMNKRLEVQLNKDNKLSLKKKATGNARLRLDVQGYKQNGTAVYNVNLSPSQEVKLVTIEGRFYKLVKNSVYEEVTQFSVDRHAKSGCTSEKFHENMGVDLCFDFSRPAIGSLFEALKPIDLRNQIADEDDDDDDHDHHPNDGHDHSVKRPQLTLSGPYHYNIILKNPSAVRKLTFEFDMTKNDQGAQLNGHYKVDDINKLDLVYSRKRIDTNRAYERAISVELREASSGNRRFAFVTSVHYRRQELIDINILLDNRIYKELNFNLVFKRQKTDDHVVPAYKLTCELNSKVLAPRHYKLDMDIVPEGKNIRSNLVVERQDNATSQALVKIGEGTLALTHSNSQDAVDYAVDLQINTYKQRKIHLYGQVLASLFKSNVDLSVEYQSRTFNLSQPVSVRVGHAFDGSNTARSYVEAHFKVPHRSIDHGLKVLYQIEIPALRLRYLEAQVRTPASGADTPYSIYLGKTESPEKPHLSEVEYYAGVDNFRVDLASRSSKLAGALIKVDDVSTLKSLSLSLVRKRDSLNKTLDVSVLFKKNAVQFGKVSVALYGDVSAVRAASAELPKQNMGVVLNMQLFKDYTGLAELKLSVDSSLAARKHAFALDFRTDGLFRLLSRVNMISAKLSVNGNKVSAAYETVRLGDMRSLKITSTNGVLRSSSAGGSEFDVAYEKTLAKNNKQHKATGVVHFRFDNFKNFEASLNLPANFRCAVSVQNTRDPVQETQRIGTHAIRLSLAHLDHDPSEREFRVRLSNVSVADSTASRFDVSISAKKGLPATFNQIDQLAYLFDADSQNQFAFIDGKRTLTACATKLALRLKSFNLVHSSQVDYKRDQAAQIVTCQVDSDTKYPSPIGGAGRLSFFRETFSLRRDLASRLSTGTYRSESDSQLTSRFYKNLSIDFTRQRTESGAANTAVNIAFRTPDDQPKTINITASSDCLAGGACKFTKLNVKQNVRPSYESRVLAPGRQLQLSECTYERRGERVREEDNYLLDVLVSLDCAGVKLARAELRVARDVRTRYPLRSIVVGVESALAYGRRRLELTHQKFSDETGVFAVGLERDQVVAFNTRFNYTRQVEAASRQLIAGEYQLTTSVGDYATKVCRMQIEKRTANYYNTLTCRVKVNSAALPVEAAYGYALKVSNFRELLFGRRQMEIDVQVPGRTLRFEYDGHRATPIDGTDDDADADDERELNGTLRFYPDFARERTRLITVTLKRDNYARGNTRTTVEVSGQNPSLKALRFEVDRQRAWNETRLHVTVGYELRNGRTNRADVRAVLSSDLDANTLSIESSLQRPAFNLLHENRFDKYTGRLQYLSIRAAKLLRLVVDKEFDPKARRISMELANPDAATYQLETERSMTAGAVYVVTSTLKQAGALVSQLTSRFDARNNAFEVSVDARKSAQTYVFTFGVFNETLAAAKITKNGNQVLGLASLSVADDAAAGYNSLVLSLKWNRVWQQLQQDVLGGAASGLVVSNSYNSYFGDIYNGLVEDLKPAYDVIRADRLALQEDLKKLGLILADFYLSAVPKLKEIAKQHYLAATASTTTTDIESLPLYKRLLTKYNNAAKWLTAQNLRVRKYSKSLSAFIPRLPTYEYNADAASSSSYQNNLVVSRPTLNARNLYQFNAEYRDYVRKLGMNVLSVKTSRMRNLDGVSVRALINKYKYRPLSAFTQVGHVYNQRHVVAFTGQSVFLKTKCKYLLAHELARNQFSVVLNPVDKTSSAGILTVYAYGQLTVELNYDKASVNGRAVALPYEFESATTKRRVTINKSNNGICVSVNGDLQVCCHEDSRSCSVATTRWFSGRVNGLLGKSNYVNTNFKEEAWYLSLTCKVSTSEMIAPTPEAVRTCYSIFGRHRHSFFRDSFLVAKPEGWQRICEFVLTANPAGKCALMKAYVYHAKAKSVEVNEPNECYQCNVQNQKFNIDQAVEEPLASNGFENGTDFVFVLLPCERSKYSLEALSSTLKRVQMKKSNKYYLVKVNEDKDASIYASETGQSSTIDLKSAYDAFNDEKSVKNVEDEAFFKGLYLAGTLFTNRLAQSRRLVLVSCGNCLRYSGLLTLKLEKRLRDRNIVVSSWGDYKMQDKSRDTTSPAIGEEAETSDELPIGYNDENVFLYKESTKKVETDNAEGYRLEHSADMCTRLAQKTGGNVFDIGHIREAAKFEQILRRLDETKLAHTNKLQRCERVETPFGDVDDFSYVRKKVEDDDVE